MRKRLTKKNSLSFLFLTAIIVCVIIACDSKMVRMEQGEVNLSVSQVPSLSLVQEPVATKIVSHTLGQAEIPLHPQRIVVLDANNVFLLDALLALEIKPIGLTRCSNCINSDPFSEVLGDLPSVGTDEQPSLEKILSLKPDLILGYEWQKSSYQLLSKIAPTVMINVYSGGNDFKRNFKHFAEILGKSDQAEGILAEYDKKIQEFRQHFGDKLKDKTVSRLSFWDSAFHVYGPDIISYSQVMSDAGLQFIPAYKNFEGENAYLRLSIETLPDWDADFLFIELYFEKDLENLKSLLDQPILQTLKAVRNEQLYVMTEYPSGGPIGANRFIDELSEYFSSKL